MLPVVNEPTLKQYRYFATVAEMGSFRKAAQRLQVSQPTLTAQIAALEAALGTQLLERTRRGAFPNPTGRMVLPHIYVMLNESREILGLASRSDSKPAGTHRFGVPHTLGPYFLPEVIPEIHKAFPSMRIFVKEDTPQSLERGLHDGTYDFILAPLPMDFTDVASERLFSESLHVVAPPDHPLVQQRGIMPADFAGENFLVVEERHHFFLLVQKLAAKFGFRLLRDYEGTSLATLRLMIGTGMGLSFLPGLYIRAEIEPRNDITTLDIGFELPRRDIAMAWRHNSPQQQLYRDICEIFRQCCRSRLQDYVAVYEPEQSVPPSGGAD